MIKSTTCVLTLWGMTSRNRYLEIFKVFPRSIRDKVSLDDDPPPSKIKFQDVFTDGELDPAWYGAIRDSGLSFSWETRIIDKQDISSGGLTLFHAPSLQDFGYFLNEQEISIHLAELKIRPEEAIREATLCEEYWAEGLKLGLHFASTRHEEMEALAKSPELRAYCAKKPRNPATS